MAGAVESARRPRARHWIVLAALLLLAAAALLPPLININRYQRKIADSIGRAVGRPVHMSTVQLRLLPRPGFEMENLVISEDPAFGAEPMLHSASVVAYIRLISLWRGRLEIARISFDEPSLNLVRNAAGQWNFGSVMLQASRIPNAPTSQRHASGALRFPYIEASNARINFKFGNVKQPFSFLNADLSVWLEQPDQWQLRFDAQPARTDLDLNLSDTGLFQLEGSLRRSSTSIGDMPVNLRAEWSSAPLGQLSRLVLGDDSGWRGDLDVRADISGTPNDAQIKAKLRAGGVHRVEFEPAQTLDFETTCEASYHRKSRSIQDATCFTPEGEGHLLLTGGMSVSAGHARPDLKLQLQHLPVASLIAGIRVIRSGFAPAAGATGTIDGAFTLAAASASTNPVIHGSATGSDVTLSVPGISKPITLPTFTISIPEAPSAPATNRRAKAANRHSKPAPPAPQAPGLFIAPLPIAMGAPTPLSVSASLTMTNFDLRVNGAATVERLLSVSRALGVPTTAVDALAPQGTADLQLGVQGPWLLPVPDPQRPLPTASVTGSIRLHNAALTTSFLAGPLEIVSAQGTFSPNRLTWSPVSIAYGKLRADGEFTQPIFCDNAAGCTPDFDIHTDTLNAAEVESTLLGGKHGQVLEQILERLDSRSHAWPSLQGQIEVGTFALETLKLQGVSARLAIKGNALTISSLDCRALGGSLHLSGTLDASVNLPAYTIDAELAHGDPAQIAALFGEKWGSGAINFGTQLQLAGYTAEQLASSADGKFHWDWTRGSLPVDADSLPALEAVAHFDRWTANGEVRESRLNLTRSVLVQGDDETALTGSLSFGRELQLDLDSPDRPLAVSGTLASPRLSTPPKVAKSTPATYRRR